jgi:malonyl-CoA O-methyltransferase
MKWPFTRRVATQPLAPQAAYALWATSYPPRPHNRLMEIEQAAVLELLPEVKGRRALDAGCGTGRYLLALKARGAWVAGVDLSQPMLRYAREISPRLSRATLCALPLTSATLDVVVSGLALGDVRELGVALRELARVVKPGGHVIYSVVHPDGGRQGWSRTFESRGRQCAVDGYWHSAREHHAACASAGLAIEAWREPRLEDSGGPVALVVRARVEQTR